MLKAAENKAHDAQNRNQFSFCRNRCMNQDIAQNSGGKKRKITPGLFG
jgi:hypothetical protein